MPRRPPLCALVRVMNAQMFATTSSTQTPVDTYLSRLSSGSRRVMAASLEVVADALSNGQLDAAGYAWAGATYGDAIRLRTWLVRAYAPSTAGRHLCAWRGVLRECWRLGDMSTDAYLRATDVSAPSRGHQDRGRLLTVAEVAMLLGAPRTSGLTVRDIALVAVLAGCGLRVAELVALDREDLALESGAIHVRHAKGDRPRTLVLPVPLRGHVAGWIELRGDQPGPLFQPIGRTGRLLPRRLSISGVIWALRRGALRAGVQSFSPHDLRRFYATELLDRGVDPGTVQRLMGHASMSTTAIYNLRRPTAAPPQADALWEALAPPRLRLLGGRSA